VKLMAPASGAELLEFKTPWIIPAVLLGGVIALAARCALECNHRPISLRLLGHCTTFLTSHPRLARATMRAEEIHSGLLPPNETLTR
jgi:hypothetical protein